MTKKELIDKLSEALGDRKQAEAAFNAVISGLSDALKAGESMTIPGFGTFKVVDRAARKDRNPQTGQEIDIAASRTVKFVPGKKLKEEMAK